MARSAADAPVDVRAFVRANLPAPPCRVLEIGAGDGALAEALRRSGYGVTAIDPDPRGPVVAAVALDQLPDPETPFDAAVAVSSLHHVEPLEASLARLRSVLRSGAVLVVDEFDVGAFDITAATWWLGQRAAMGATEAASAEELVDEHRNHLHTLEALRRALGRFFAVGVPVRGPWLYRWDLTPSLRAEEEALIAAGYLPAVGARFVAVGV